MAAVDLDLTQVRDFLTLGVVAVGALSLLAIWTRGGASVSEKLWQTAGLALVGFAAAAIIRWA
jgi:hypothetical protein